MKILEEWFIQAPWGKIALVSYGNTQGEPVLLVHGRQDSVDTFRPLLEHLPDRFYYVGMDLPGSGKSEDFPVGVMAMRLSPVSAIHFVVRHLKWDKFVYIGHSMGGELGLFYNTIYPNKITKLVLLDVKPGLQRLQMSDQPTYFKMFYQEYYDNYNRYNVDDRRYTKGQALQAVMRARGLTEEQAEVILKRNLISVGDDKYRLSWDKRQKILAPTNLLPEQYTEIFTKHPVPTLFINANQPNGQFYTEGQSAVDSILTHMKTRHLYVMEVAGGHDVHFTDAGRLASDVCAFLLRDFGGKSKL